MRIDRYSEVYLDDAVRLCKYIAKEDGKITIVPVDNITLFPGLPNHMEFNEDRNYAVRVERDDVIVAECAYCTRREPGEDIKHRNRWLASVKLGDEIRAARERAGLSQEELGERTGYRVYSINAIEHGRYIMDTKLLFKLVEAMGADVRIV